MAFEDLNESTLPLMSLVALIFTIVMGIVYGGNALMHITNSTGEEEIPFNLFSLFNAWAIVISLMVLIMLVVIGMSIVRKHS